MSENSLKIRGKFINKLATKIEDLNDNFILLSKVDKKIFKKINNQMSENMNNQRGGASNPANNAILAALKKAQEMKAQQESLASSLTKLEDIEKVIKEITKTFTNITNIINQIQFGPFNVSQLDNINGLETLNENTLTDPEITALTTYLNNPEKKPRSLGELKSDTDASVFKDKIDQVGFNILFGDNLSPDRETDEEQEEIARGIAARAVRREGENADTAEFLEEAGRRVNALPIVVPATPVDPVAPVNPAAPGRRGIDFI